MCVFSAKTTSRLTPRLFFQGVMTEFDPPPPLFCRSRIRKTLYFQYTRQSVVIILNTQYGRTPYIDNRYHNTQYNTHNHASPQWVSTVFTDQGHGKLGNTID